MLYFIIQTEQYMHPHTAWFRVNMYIHIQTQPQQPYSVIQKQLTHPHTVIQTQHTPILSVSKQNTHIYITSTLCHLKKAQKKERKKKKSSNLLVKF